MERHPPQPSKPADVVRPLRCLNPDCRALLPYEVTTDNVLYVDLAWTARLDGTRRYFPCPRCGGRNLVDPIETPGRPLQHRVSAWEPPLAPPPSPPAPSHPARPEASEPSLDLIPRSVRDKLDHVGIKLHLADWRRLSLADRQRLIDLPCDTSEAAAAYTAQLDALLLAATGQSAERLGRTS